MQDVERIAAKREAEKAIAAARRAGRVRREEQDRVADLIEFLLYETESQQVADVLVRLARDVLDAGPAPLTRQPIQ